MDNESMKVVFLASPVGILKIEGDVEVIKLVTFCGQPLKEDPSEVLLDCKKQLMEYFNKKRQQFTIPIKPSGTAFQKEVWDRVCHIPFGKTLSYSEIARDLGSLKKVRAVGVANGKNPIPIIIPCHRVIGINGALIGYAGGKERKKWLLDLEKEFIQLSLFN
jgi:methylated-DNA-[protein]-cysteine S-methyltransferase